MERSSWFVAVSVGVMLVSGCRSRDTSYVETGDRAPSPTSLQSLASEQPLRETVEGNARLDDVAKELGPERIDGPLGTGGGPQTTGEVFWPSQARDHLARTRCEARAGCGTDENESACFDRERKRLAQWRVETCERIEMRDCVQAIRAESCPRVDATLPAACAPRAVCKQP